MPAIDRALRRIRPSAGDEFVIFGYSQSAVIASLLKQDLIDNPIEDPDVAPSDLYFFLLSNPMRPNGGFLSRGPKGLTIPILGVTFYGATPTDSCETGNCYETVDVAAQYDGLGGDAAVGLTNVLAVVNAVMGYLLLHGDMENASFDDALYQGSHGDTDYYIVPTRRLPILMPFEGFIPSPILTALDAPLRAAIEGAYARDVNPGIATKVGLLPFLESGAGHPQHHQGDPDGHRRRDRRGHRRPDQPAARNRPGDQSVRCRRPRAAGPAVDRRRCRAGDVGTDRRRLRRTHRPR